MKLKGKVALITGASRGIGRSCAIEMAREGADVAINYRSHPDEAEEVARIVRESGCRAITLQGDVADRKRDEELVEKTVAELGRLDMAVNNAGISNESTTVVESSTEKYRAMVDTNILGVDYCMKHEIAQMLKQGKGAIVNLASIAGLNGIPWAGPYASTKHAVVGLTKSSALDHAAQGIRINAVAPGAIKTDILARQLAGGDENYNEATISAMHPMNRMGRPEEVANAICWLLSDEASFVTGHILTV